jgi:heme/copper-type cytochrome/quinol oxidase subunit 3
MDHAPTATHGDAHADAHGGHVDFDAEMDMVAKLNWPPVSLGKFVMWLFLATEVMFFTGLIGTYFVLRLATPEWPDPTLTLNVPLTAFNTFLLICSSVTMVKALEWAGKGDMGKMKMFLLATTVIGACFLSVQVIEYRKLGWTEPFMNRHAAGDPAKTVFCFDASHVKGEEYDKEYEALKKEIDPKTGESAAWPDRNQHYHFTPRTNVFASTFYIMTGCHGAHVAGGVILMAIITLMGFMGKFTQQKHEGIELAGLYWHFVDLVWILLFTVVYLF